MWRSSCMRRRRAGKRGMSLHLLEAVLCSFVAFFVLPCEVWRYFCGALWSYAVFYVIRWQFAALPVSAQSLQRLAFIAIQPGTDGTLAPTDKISLASLIQAVSLTAAYYTGNNLERCFVKSQTGFKRTLSEYLSVNKHLPLEGSVSTLVSCLCLPPNLSSVKHFISSSPDDM